jgi:hypothetical protein
MKKKPNMTEEVNSMQVEMVDNRIINCHGDHAEASLTAFFSHPAKEFIAVMRGGGANFCLEFIDKNSIKMVRVNGSSEKMQEIFDWYNRESA